MIMSIILSLMCVVGAAIALNARDFMRGVLGMALLFVGIAGFFGTLGAWFLAAAQLFLFVGGVVTLFILAFNAAPPQTRERQPLHAVLLWSILPTVLIVTLVLFLPAGWAQAAVVLPAGHVPAGQSGTPEMSTAPSSEFIISQEPPAGRAITDLAGTLLGRYGWLINVALLLLFSAVIGANYLLEDERDTKSHEGRSPERDQHGGKEHDRG